MELRAVGLTKRYGAETALNDFSCVFREGIYGILGPNGAGKTTLIRLILSLIPATAGNALWNGVPTGEKGSGFRTAVGYLPQDNQFYRDFSARAFLEYICELKDVPRDERARQIGETLEFVNLTNAADKKIGAYSGGMRQRLGVAQALIGYPPILILDEPTAGLDPIERARFRNVISSLSAGRIVILATHIVSDIELIANQVILLRDGRIARDGSTKSLLTEVEGKVWEWTVPETMIDSVLKTYRVGNMYREGDRVTARIVGDTAPDPGCVSVRATLEDAFLYFCGADDDGSDQR